MAADFRVSKEVAILGVSLFVQGMGVGPLLLGPLSEFYGRNPVYWASYFVFFVLSFPVAFAPNIGMPGYLHMHHLDIYSSNHIADLKFPQRSFWSFGSYNRKSSLFFYRRLCIFFNPHSPSAVSVPTDIGSNPKCQRRSLSKYTPSQ